jgi:hypothetical protein
VQGRVVDTTGHPVPDTCVTFGPGASARTDANGYFVAPVVNPIATFGRFALVDDGCRTDTGPYWQSDSLRIEGVPATIQLVAHRMGGLSGRLVGPLGLPIGGACVWASGTVDGQLVSYQYGVTAADGTWHVDRLVTGDYGLRIRPSCTGGSSWYEPAQRGRWDNTTYAVSLGTVTAVPTLVAVTRWDCPTGEGVCEPHDL